MSPGILLPKDDSTEKTALQRKTLLQKQPAACGNPVDFFISFSG